MSFSLTQLLRILFFEVLNRRPLYIKTPNLLLNIAISFWFKETIDSILLVENISDIESRANAQPFAILQEKSIAGIQEM